MVWMTLNKNEIAIIAEIEQQKDRAAAIIAAAYLEGRLTETIKAAFKNDKEIMGRVFSGYGPLSTFSAKADIGFLLGFYRKEIHRSIFTIKSIRNEFAHNPKPLTFRSQKIRDLCRNLPGPITTKKFELSREDMELLLSQKDHELTSKAFDLSVWSGRDTPRRRYLGVVKYLLFQFMLIKELTEIHPKAYGQIRYYDDSGRNITALKKP